MNSEYKTILVERQGSRLYVTLNRPQARNAITGEMRSELSAVVSAIRDDRSVRVLIMRGAGGVFCAGGDIKGFKRIFQGEFSAEQVAAQNRSYGEFMTELNELPQTVVMLVEGGAIGGGLGMVCVSDIGIATANTRFALSETSLGVPPAQIAAFVVQRIGFTQARRLMLTASRFTAEEAERLGLVHFVVPDSDALEQKAEEILKLINRCGPNANAVTKAILHSTQNQPLPATLDMAAQHFAECMQSDEGREGVAAFLEKRKPKWRKL
ncbi:MAG: enoyl-CoA hydratase/isomerase family protein [Ardenticatenaceae bacterium]